MSATPTCNSALANTVFSRLLWSELQKYLIDLLWSGLREFIFRFEDCFGVAKYGMG
jgi:hypothetical protein